jgi:hypothetical protein
MGFRVSSWLRRDLLTVGNGCMLKRLEFDAADLGFVDLVFTATLLGSVILNIDDCETSLS